MRWVFGVGSVLVTAAGFQLFVLTDHTDRFFAWTISPGLSATFLGGFYFTALVLAAGSATEREWARARVGVFGVWLFVTLTLVATLLHLDKFHFHDPGLLPRGAAWLWTIIYVVEPPAVLAAIVMQLRTPGRERPREHPPPTWYRSVIAAQSVVLLVVGLWLFVAPSSVGWWPWTLTPLVAQAMAAWLLGLGVVLATATRENDLERIRIATASYVVLGVLQLVAAARYASDLRSGTACVLSTWRSSCCSWLQGSWGSRSGGARRDHVSLRRGVYAEGNREGTSAGGVPITMAISRWSVSWMSPGSPSNASPSTNTWIDASGEQ